jgi:hypothetical protein
MGCKRSKIIEKNREEQSAHRKKISRVIKSRAENPELSAISSSEPELLQAEVDPISNCTKKALAREQSYKEANEKFNNSPGKGTFGKFICPLCD